MAFFGEGTNQRSFVFEVMVRRGWADVGTAGQFAQAEAIHADLTDEDLRGLEQCGPQVAVVVRLGSRVQFGGRFADGFRRGLELRT